MRQGLAELVAYLQLAGEWPKMAVDDDVQEQVSWQSEPGRAPGDLAPHYLLRIDDECFRYEPPSHRPRTLVVVVPLLKGVCIRRRTRVVGLAAESAGGVRDYVAVLGLS